MSGEYRITVRGVMSERFCQGFPGLSRRVLAERTVLEGGPRRPPRSPTCWLGSATSASRSSTSSRRAAARRRRGGLMMSRLAALATRRPWRVIAIAVVVPRGRRRRRWTPHLQPHGDGIRGPERRVRRGPRPARGRHRAPTRSPGSSRWSSPGTDVRSGAGQAAVEKAAATIAADRDVAQVVTAFNGGGAALISKDGTRPTWPPSSSPISDDAARGRRRPHRATRSRASPR